MTSSDHVIRQRDEANDCKRILWRCSWLSCPTTMDIGSVLKLETMTPGQIVVLFITADADGIMFVNIQVLMGFSFLIFTLVGDTKSYGEHGMRTHFNTHRWRLKGRKRYMSQLMRLGDIHRRPKKAQANLHIRAVSPESSLFAHMKYGSRRRVLPKLSYLAPLDGCVCMFAE